MRRVAVLAAAVLAAALGCGPSATPSPNPAGGTPSSPVDGVVLTIDATGLSQVHGFTLRTATGQTLRFVLGTLENPTQFPPGHLAEHQANALPVRVFFVVDSSGAPVVYRLEDAPRASPAAS